MQIRQSRLSYKEVYNILQKGDLDFNPPLSSVLDIDKYAQKLSEFANFLLLEDKEQIYGCIAYYLNEEGRFVYISHYWIDAGIQRQGYGERMLQELRSLYKERYQEVRLEVAKKNPALFFYLREGFSMVEDRIDKFLVSLSLNKESK